MTTTLINSAPAVTTSATRRTPVAVTSIVASLAAAAVTTGYGAIAIAAHGAMQAGDPGASKAATINAASFGIGTLMSAAIGVVIAVAIARYSSRPAALWTRVTVVLLAVSLVFPLLASHTDSATRFALAGAHLLAAAVIIPVVRRRLSVS
jgi:hypothetical protein